jgi:predicted Zn-dependent protease
MKFASKSDDKMFRDKPGTLAYAYFPNGQKIGGDITFNDSVIWTTNGKPVNAHEVFPDKYPPHTKTKLRTYNMVHTLLHECGHAIGLKHCEQHKDCIMYPYYNARVILHSHDVQRIQSMYGERKLLKQIIDYFRKRMLRKWG